MMFGAANSVALRVHAHGAEARRIVCAAWRIVDRVRSSGLFKRNAAFSKLYQSTVSTTDKAHSLAPCSKMANI